MKRGDLRPLVRAATFDYFNGYLKPLRDAVRAADYLRTPVLENDAGVPGALLLAQSAAKRVI